MSHVVLFYDTWPLQERSAEVALAIANGLNCRAIPLGGRPHLGMYEVVVLVLPGAAALDPRVSLLAVVGSLAGKTVALATDAPGFLRGLFFTKFEVLATTLGRVTLYPHPLDAGGWWPFPGGQARTPAPDPVLEAARQWGLELATRYPATTYPRGEAGTRATTQHRPL